MKVIVTLNLGEHSRTFELQGRLGWTMAQLVMAGPNGVTTIERPAPRWSGYVHMLRQRGIEIETIMEEHGGTYGGRHARYRLAQDVAIQVLGKEAAA